MAATEPSERSAPPRRRPAFLIAHACVVLVVTGMLLVLGLRETADANIGGGIAYLAALPLGLPWSLLLPLAPAGWSPAAMVLGAVGAAWLNVAVHAAVRRWWRRGQRTS